MGNVKFFSSFFFLLALWTNYMLGQGCSDAGFCTINSFKPQSDGNKNDVINQIKLGTFFGSADKKITVYGGYIEYVRKINDKFGVDLKLTSLAQNGNEISVFGLSDIFINANYRANDKLNLTVGAKLPLSLAGSSLNNLALPMDYQSSLGTFDFILGFGYKIGNLQLVTAYQQPLSQNDNKFFANSYPAGSELSSFQSTNKFKRNGDVLLRLAYPVTLSPKIKLTPSLLPIYHLSNDTYQDEQKKEKEIIGSKGLTLNGNLYLDYDINNTSMIQLNTGMPFVVRNIRPDGLTRSFIVNLEYKFNF